jgi:hypothetical protein
MSTLSSNEQVEDDCETCGGTGEIFTLEREELPCPSCVSRELNQQIAELRAAHEPSVDVKQMNRDLCAKDGHVLGVTARPCLRCHEWFDPIYGTEQMRKDTLENASPETAPEIVEWKNVDTGETGTLCTLCGHEQNPNQSPSADIEALLESFVWAVRRDNDNGDQYTRQEVKDLRAELLAAIRAVQPPEATLDERRYAWLKLHAPAVFLDQHVQLQTKNNLIHVSQVSGHELDEAIDCALRGAECPTVTKGTAL